MGEIEKEHKRKNKRVNLKKVLLQTVGTVGLVGVALVAPGVLGGLDKLGLIPGKRFLWNVKRSRDRLVEKGLLKYEGRFLKLTKKGETELRRFELEDFFKEKPKKWDGKWRVLIFDIPERKRRLRDVIRHTLTEIGFVKLQNSVWVYPYDCEDYLNLLKADLSVGKDLLYMIVDSIEYDSNLRKKFNLR